MRTDFRGRLEGLSRLLSRKSKARAEQTARLKHEIWTIWKAPPDSRRGRSCSFCIILFIFCTYVLKPKQLPDVGHSTAETNTFLFLPVYRASHNGSCRSRAPYRFALGTSSSGLSIEKAGGNWMDHDVCFPHLTPRMIIPSLVYTEYASRICFYPVNKMDGHGITSSLSPCGVLLFTLSYHLI